MSNTTSHTDSNRAVAEAFSGHRFADTYDRLAPDVVWPARGESRSVGREAVIEACDGSAAELSRMDTEFLTFRSIADGDTVAVETVGRYQEAGEETSFVASVDLYDFDNGLLTRIVSYAAEVNDPRGDDS